MATLGIIVIALEFMVELLRMFIMAVCFSFMGGVS